MRRIVLGADTDDDTSDNAVHERKSMELPRASIIDVRTLAVITVTSGGKAIEWIPTVCPVRAALGLGGASANAVACFIVCKGYRAQPVHHLLTPFLLLHRRYR